MNSSFFVSNSTKDKKTTQNTLYFMEESLKNE